MSKLSLSVVWGAALILLAATSSGVEAFSMASSFGGSVVASSVQNGANLEMKKGKANVPPQMRGQYKRQREMADMQRQMIESSTPGADGLPVFNLFVRSGSKGVSPPFVVTLIHPGALAKNSTNSP